MTLFWTLTLEKTRILCDSLKKAKQHNQWSINEDIFISVVSDIKAGELERHISSFPLTLTLKTI